MFKKIILFFATAGVGYLPGAQGTYGTIVAVGLYLLLYSLPPLHFLFFTFTFSLFAIWAADHAEKYLNEKDSGKIVIDEIAGYFVTMLFIPARWELILAGFVLFRLFDILKPFPIREFEKRLKGGWGVVCDDLAAGVFANIVLQIVWRVFNFYKN